MDHPIANKYLDYYLLIDQHQSLIRRIKINLRLNLKRNLKMNLNLKIDLNTRFTR